MPDGLVNGYCEWKEILFHSLPRRQFRIMTSFNGNISMLLALWPGNSPVTGEFPTQRPVTRSFDVFFDLLLEKRLSKQSRRWWFETPWRLVWRHCNGNAICLCSMAKYAPLRFCEDPTYTFSTYNAITLYVSTLITYWKTKKSVVRALTSNSNIYILKIL